MKAKVTLYIDPEILCIAKEKGCNLSQLLENAILDKYHLKRVVTITEQIRRHFEGPP